MWRHVFVLTIVGYGCMTRSFAYLGIPAVNLYIGEALLGGFLLARPREGVARWVGALVRPRRLSGLSWALLGTVAYGTLQVGRGVARGHDVVSVFRDFAFNYYALYLLVGLWVAERHPGMLLRTIRVLAWSNGVYGLAYILVLHDLGLQNPWAPVPVDLFGQPGASGIAILGLVAFEQQIRRPAVMIPLVLNSLVLLAMQVRAEWVALLGGIVTWLALTGRVRPVLVSGGVCVALLAAAHVANVRLTTSRGVVSTTELIGRALAPVDQELASEFTDSATLQAGTFAWRTKWWRAIWESAHDDPVSTWFGHGYGYGLYGLATHVGAYVRTPHSWFFFGLGYGGWFGVAAFLTVQLAILRLFWTMTGPPNVRAFGLAFLLLAMVMGLASNLFETPFGAIPFYLLVGAALGEGGVVRQPRDAALPVPSGSDQFAVAQPYGFSGSGIVRHGSERRK